jgi:hypothetical protein
MFYQEVSRVETDGCRKPLALRSFRHRVRSAEESTKPMRNLFFTRDDDGRHAHWWAIVGFLALDYACTIGLCEEFWKLFTGGFSPLVALYAFFLATLIAIRVLAEAFLDPYAVARHG